MLLAVAGPTAVGKTALTVASGPAIKNRDYLGRLAPVFPRAEHRHGQAHAGRNAGRSGTTSSTRTASRRNTAPAASPPTATAAANAVI
ncbi:MAG: hypothetical protein WKG07_42260 [Hymenobacter sp.]